MVMFPFWREMLTLHDQPRKLCFVQGLRNSSNVIWSCWLWVFWDQKRRLWMNWKPNLTPGVIWRPPRTSIPPVSPMCMQLEVRVQIHCHQVKHLCSEHARTSYNVFIFAHTSRRLKWAVLIKYCPLSIVINVFWIPTVFHNQQILLLTGTVPFCVKDDKVCSIKRLFSFALMALVIQLMW